MDYILTETGKKLPVYNVIKDRNGSLELQFLESKLNKTSEELVEILRSYEETKTLTAYSDGDVESNAYSNYSSLDVYNVKYNYVVQEARPAIAAKEAVLDEDGEILFPAIEAKAAVPEIVDNMITATLMKLSDVEVQLREIRSDVNNLNIGMAEILGV